ncbi:hypothetical protein ACLKA7_009229 [Drosophila subpalustris]
MSRKGTKDQNDISLIIGTLPKRLQKKFAASCSQHSHAAEDAENAEPTSTPAAAAAVAAAEATTRPVTILSKPKGNAGNAVKVNVPALDASGCSSLENRSNDVGIPGILRVNASPAARTDKARSGNGTRRRGRSHPIRMQEQTPLSPLSRVRLTTDHPVWFEQLLNMPNAKIIIQLYDQLMVLQQRNLILNNWKNFCSLHRQLQEAFCGLLLEQLKFVCEHKVDAFFWKLLFYNVRDYLKRQHTDIAHNHTLLLIEQSVKFYRGLYEKLMTKYISSRCESAVKVVAQRLLICLGDLSRYRANHLQLTDFAEACKYYQRAQELVPGNGAPYNQLAIISIYNHKRFDAVYYYMRSLLTSNAIQSAKESLLDLFDDIRRKYEETEMKQSPMHCIAGKSKKSKQMRREVWIYPDGMRRLHRTDVKRKIKNKANIAEVNRYDELAPEELLPRVVSLYLYLVGKLFTATDVECMYQLLGKLQIQLGATLKHDNLLSRTKLMKMVALNVFVLEHNKLKVERREMRYHSFNFANSLFGLMLSKANQLLAVLADDSTDLQCLADAEYSRVNTYLQYVKIYCQWLTINVELWEPVRTEDHSTIDCWAELQTLFEHIEGILNKLDIETDQRQMNVLLDEDIMLSGFEPLGRDVVKRECYQRGSERQQFIERIQKILQFQEFYIQHQDSLQLPLNASFTIEDLNAAMQVALNDFDVSNCITSTSEKSCTLQPKVEEDETIAFSNVCDDVTQLCKLKKQLEEKAKVKQICNSKLEEILKLVDSKLYIEVRPRYLLPDTNCFIDCLEDIEKLSMEFKRYTVIIPLTVVKELDGLSKGVKLESYRSSKQNQRIHHFDEVSSRAKKSLEFIRSAKNNVKCATTKGSIINASMFALVEETYASNDDKILATAVAVSKTVSSEQCRDGKCFIQTELVLITTDRNLRVKALARNLAVSALDEFLQWANDCRGSA